MYHTRSTPMLNNDNSSASLITATALL